MRPFVTLGGHRNIAGLGGFTGTDLTTGGDTAATASHVVTLPLGVGLGQRLVAAFSWDAPSSGSVTWPAGWLELSDDYNENGGAGLSIAWRDADGTEGASITVTTDVSRSGAWAIYRTTSFAANAPEVTTALVGMASTTPSSANLTPSWGAADVRWMTVFAASSDPARTVTGYPPNYDDRQTYVAATASGLKAYLGFATRDLNAAAENPGFFNISGVDNWTAQTIALKLP